MLLLSVEYAQSINFMDKLKGLFGCTQIHSGPYGLGGIEVEIPLKLRGLVWICVQPNKA
jgi:hypothetical protein